MRCIAIDWSGARNSKGKIWFAEAYHGRLRRLEPLSGRPEAIDDAIRATREHRETVVGLDFAFSMPEWFMRRNGCASVYELWRLVGQQGERWLDSCEPPFWGRKGKARPPLKEDQLFRKTDLSVRSVGGIRPKSCFQICGPGTVGTGSLRGMPFLSTLKEAGFAIWPFDAPRLPLVVEIYPRLLTGPVVKSSAAGRTEYLRAWPHLTDGQARLAASCEDAFDAAVSALMMDRHRAHLAQLPALNGKAGLEGEIWSPRPVRPKNEG